MDHVLVVDGLPTDDDGTVGWDEAFALSRTAATIVKEVFPGAVVGQSPWDADGLADETYTDDLGGYHFAREAFSRPALTGVEVTMWDLSGKDLGKPVREILGGESRDLVAPNASTMYITERDDDPP